MAIALEPEAVVVDRALLQPVMKVMGWGVAIGVLWTLQHFVRATVGGVAGLIGHVPGIGGILSGPVNAVYHWMDAEFGKAEAACDAQMAEGLHALARLVERIGHDFRTHGTILYQLAQVMTHPLSISAYRGLFGAEWKATAGIRNSIKHATNGYIGAAIETRIRPIYGELQRVERWTFPRIKSLEREVTHDIPKDVAGLRIRTKTIEGELSRAWDAIRANQGILASLSFVGAVALALDKLGYGWLRCSSVRNLGRRIGCGGFGLLETLLGDAFQAFAVLDICDFAHGAQVLAQELEPLLMELVDVEDALVGCHGATALPALTMRALHLPPTNLGLPLAA